MARRQEETEPQSSLRREAVRFANALIQRADTSAGYAAEDVANMLKFIGIHLTWSPESDVVALTRAARRQHAYKPDGLPLPGDIVLFHNQWDRNGNQKGDDWLTGCGVVVVRSADRFEAVIRTGHRPRRVVVSPGMPSVHRKDGVIINSFVRLPTRTDRADTEYLAGQLFAGFIDLDKLP